MSLETKDLSIGYDSDLVKNISFTVAPGRIVTVIGPNGSGKSTLLKTVTGSLAKRAGVVFIDGKNRDEMPRKDVARNLSMVSTVKVSPELMTCREVIESGRYAYTGIFGRLSDTDRQKVEEALCATDTKSIEMKPFANISDGQRQRVMLARAICQEPKIMVLDEPTSFLDIRYRIDILSRIRELAVSNGIGILMSVHEPETAMKLSDTVIAMSDGKIRRIGTPREVFEEGFIRSLYKLEGTDVSLLGARPWIDEKEAGHKLSGKKPLPDDGQHRDDPEYCPGVIMVAGTMSNVGKSVIAAGLCRVLTRRGYKVSPFKSQNMANNSYVTAEGLEMGRAQVVQAECCNRDPKVFMNPVLLKPVTDKGSQVIVNGIPAGNMNAKEYFQYKKKLIPVIDEAFRKAYDSSDAVVIEGAGSIAEINLKENDIVNMGLARMTDSPVILVGDIDRGGVFAQLVGTLELLEPSERARIKGLVINMFRGDRALLEPGIKLLEQKTGIPVLGVVPYMKLDIDDEDSLSEKLHDSKRGTIDIAVVKLPHIANFTDLDALSQVDDVSVRYIEDPEGLARCDLVIIPGTKNTISDMNWLEESGMADALRSYASGSGIVIGICGGYQMLGMSISDPEGCEGGGKTSGLGLLPVSTVITAQKVRRQFEGIVSLASGALSSLTGEKITGYEIHMGTTECLAPLSEFTSDGSGYCSGNIYGTYVHGLFDERGISSGIIRILSDRAAKDIDLGGITGRREYKEKQYEHLADVLEESLDMDAICKIMKISSKNGTDR
ncbi:MAG: cobyric acid synthase [Lachnospiraceae bacterium]|nr:cobyric acid synthase [Lachnospiraceae bacterium]